MTKLIKNDVLLFVLALTASFPASGKSPELIFEDVSASIVIVDILSATGEKTGHGSGVVIGAGTVVTNCHVTDEATFLQVRWKETVHSAAFEYRHAAQDLCLVSAPDLRAPKVDIGAVENVKIGSRVFAIGAPRGFELTMSDGIVSGLRNVDQSVVIQTNASISPGSSGGGLFDEDGRLIGITTWLMRESQNLNFALSADLIPELHKKMEIAKAERAMKERLKSERRKAEANKLAATRKALDEARQRLEFEERQRDEETRIIEEKQRLERELRQTEVETLKLQDQRKRVEHAKSREGSEGPAEAKRAEIRGNEESARQKRLTQVQSLLDTYTDKIRTKIRQNFRVPEPIDTKRPAIYTVVLLPTGDVLETKLLESSGNTNYDKAVERAILRSQPLPLPPDSKLFGYFRELRLPVDFQRMPNLPQTDTKLRTARIIKQFKAPYPKQALRMGIEGKVKARVAVNEEGSVASVEIVDSVPKGVFDKTVEATLSRYMFESSGFAFQFEHQIVFTIENGEDEAAPALVNQPLQSSATQ